MPTPSLPPPPQMPASLADLLEECVDGLWYLIRGDYSSRASASQTKYALSKSKSLPPGRWEFRHGPHGDKFGVWARNLDGPRAGEDEKDT